MPVLKSILINTAIVAGCTALTMSATAQSGRSLNVTVVDATGRPVAGATVCLGTTADRGGSDVGTTSAQGTVAMTAPASGQVLVTANVGGRGSDALVPAMLAMATLRLPPGTSGPACPSTAQRSLAPGQFSIPRAGIDAAVARSAANPIGERIGMLSGHRCLGAAGMNCGDMDGEAGSCIKETGTCLVNAGSWRHDECCVANPEGGMCDNNPAEFVGQVLPGGAQVCQGDFNTAVDRVRTPLTWMRRVDFAARNTSGRVDHAAYCAPGGTLMPRGEEGYCCSRTSRAPDAAQTVAIAAWRFTGVRPADIRVCN